MLPGTSPTPADLELRYQWRAIGPALSLWPILGSTSSPSKAGDGSTARG